MARIRTIKPEFFTSADIVELDPLTRLLYQATWCEADREGRLEWKPRTFKLRYFPGDNCDIDAMCNALVSAGLIVLYGDGLAYIPSFGKHQVINGRESESTLPTPDLGKNSPKASRVTDASRTRTDASRRKEGKEGKGREDASRDAGTSASRGTRLPADWKPSETEMRWAVDARPDLETKTEVEKFRDYWHAKTGQGATKRDWPATWRNWIRNANGAPRRGQLTQAPASPAASRPL